MRKYIEREVSEQIQKQRLSHKEEIRKRIEKAIETLADTGKQSTNAAICDLVGISQPTLKRYKRTMLVFKPTKPISQPIATQPYKVAKEDELLAKLEAIIHELERCQETVTQRAVLEILGMSRGHLQIYPRVIQFLKHHIGMPHYLYQRKLQFQSRQKEFILKAELALHEMELSGHPITQSSIANNIGLSVNRFYKYPQLVIFVKAAIAERKVQMRILQFQLREEEIINKVIKSIQELKRLNSPISSRSIARNIGMSAPGLQYYPRVKQLIETSISEQRQAKLDAYANVQTNLTVTNKPSIVRNFIEPNQD